MSNGFSLGVWRIRGRRVLACYVTVVLPDDLMYDFDAIDELSALLLWPLAMRFSQSVYKLYVLAMIVLYIQLLLHLRFIKLK